jgi:hypothetical protein
MTTPEVPTLPGRSDGARLDRHVDPHCGKVPAYGIRSTVRILSTPCE